MKIYHKTSFYAALVSFSGSLILVLDILLAEHEWSFVRVLPIISMLIAGLGSLRRATNKKAAKALMIEESDEMLMLERMKAYRAAFWTTLYLFLLIALVACHFLDSSFGLALVLCSLLVVAIMLFVYFFVSCALKLQHE